MNLDEWVCATCGEKPDYEKDECGCTKNSDSELRCYDCNMKNFVTCQLYLEHFITKQPLVFRKCCDTCAKKAMEWNPRYKKRPFLPRGVLYK